MNWWSVDSRTHAGRERRRRMKEEYERQHPLDGDNGSMFAFVTRGTQQFAIAKSGREYALWGDDTPARLRRVQLKAYEEVEEELVRRDGGRSEQPTSVSVIEESQQ